MTRNHYMHMRAPSKSYITSYFAPHKCWMWNSVLNSVVGFSSINNFNNVGSYSDAFDLYWKAFLVRIITQDKKYWCVPFWKEKWELCRIEPPSLRFPIFNVFMSAAKFASLLSSFLRKPEPWPQTLGIIWEKKKHKKKRHGELRFHLVIC